MKVSRLPPAAIDRLLLLDRHADVLARQAALAEAEVAGARSIMGGHSKADPAGILRARTEFPETLKRAQDARQRADSAMRTASSAKAYVDLLPDDAEVAAIEPPRPNGVDLSEVRSKIAAICAEIGRIKSMPPPSDRHLVEQFVDELRRPAEAQIKEMISRWPHFTALESLRMGNDSDADLALMTVMVPRAGMVDHLCSEIDAIADAAMRPSERPGKIAALEAQLMQLQSLQAHFVNGAVANGQTDVAHDPQTPPAVVLGITVVERETKLLAS